MAIKEFRDENRWLSNFTPVKITLGGIQYPSVEHAYMSAKGDDMGWKSKCADKQITAGQIKRECKDIMLVDDWREIKVHIMRHCLTEKFYQSPFKEKLLATKIQHIEEGNTWGDVFWGVNLTTGEGKNMLGKLIMEIRSDLFHDMIYLLRQLDSQKPLNELIGLTEEECEIFMKNERRK
tara:strand:- start:7980 stop:8516 length:537 start_codon:yes stop_codon:yes gene_type:complete